MGAIDTHTHAPAARTAVSPSPAPVRRPVPVGRRPALPARPGHELSSRLAARMPVQASLRVSRPHDHEEVEAEAVGADLGPEKAGCDCGGDCGECGDEEPSPARAPAGLSRPDASISSSGESDA